MTSSPSCCDRCERDLAGGFTVVGTVEDDETILCWRCRPGSTRRRQNEDAVRD